MSEGIFLNGKLLKIKKRGLFYPVDVELKNNNGKNILNISTKINFIEALMSDSEAPLLWKQAVLDGMRAWSGRYLVFGNQLLDVVVDVEETEKLSDSIFVICIDEKANAEMQDNYGKLNLKNAEKFFSEGRSFTTVGFANLGWKAYLPRFVYMLDATLQDFKYARDVAKHEFGHVLGLGDLYRDLSLGLNGVDDFTYDDIKPYYLGENYFNMVMCNNGPVTNNDIEMVLLAFHTNKFQNYQKIKPSDKISDALGNGN